MRVIHKCVLKLFDELVLCKVARGDNKVRNGIQLHQQVHALPVLPQPLRALLFVSRRQQDGVVRPLVEPQLEAVGLQLRVRDVVHHKLERALHLLLAGRRVGLLAALGEHDVARMLDGSRRVVRTHEVAEPLLVELHEGVRVPAADVDHSGGLAVEPGELADPGNDLPEAVLAEPNLADVVRILFKVCVLADVKVFPASNNEINR